MQQEQELEEIARQSKLARDVRYMLERTKANEEERLKRLAEWAPERAASAMLKHDQELAEALDYEEKFMNADQEAKEEEGRRYAEALNQFEEFMNADQEAKEKEDNLLAQVLQEQEDNLLVLELNDGEIAAAVGRSEQIRLREEAEQRDHEAAVALHAELNAPQV